MKFAIFLIIYLSGYLASYFIARREFRKHNEWTVRMRTIILLLSLLSWIMIIISTVAGAMKQLARNLENENEAKW